MDGKPLLIFPEPQAAEKAKRSGGGGGVRIPDHERQAVRLQPQFSRLHRQLEARRARLQVMPKGTVPEMVLVMELAEPTENFKSTLERAGLEWLDEIDSEDIKPDDDFYLTDSKGLPSEKPLRGRVFLTLTDLRAMDELMSLWKRWQAEPAAK